MFEKHESSSERFRRKFIPFEASGEECDVVRMINVRKYEHLRLYFQNCVHDE